MAYIPRRHRFACLVLSVVAFTASAARADIDGTGTWYVAVPDLGFTDTEQWVQTGSILVIDGAAGTINPQTGDFVVLFPPDPTNVCLQPHSGSLSGTVAPDGQTFTGEAGVCGNSPTLCCGLGGGVSFSVIGSRNPLVCGDGIIVPPETCDDGNSVAGDGCDATCQVESCRVCSGAPSVCTLAPDGSPCDDGDACTASACDGSGTCVVTGPADCDDGNPCTVDSCVEPSGCVHTADIRSCRSAHVNTLSVAVKDPSTDKLKWRWTQGEATDLSDFGTPTGTTAYTLCIFAGAANAVVFAAEVPPDAQKWTAIPPHRVKYKDISGAADGINQVQLFAEPAGKSRVFVDGKGMGLSLSGPLLSTPPYDLPLRIQLSNSSTNACWSATFDALDVKHNDFSKFGAKSKLP